MNHKLAIVTLATTLSISSLAFGQAAPKPENQIKWRQSNYQVLAWNAGRIKASVDGTYNKDEVLRAANSIAAVANSNLLALFTPGSETGKGWRDTTVKPAFFTDKRAAELNNAFIKEANELVKVAQSGDVAAVKEQHGKLAKACKACHDDFRVTN
ncbi:cytochrome c [Piscinibacter sp. HJYY11]|uniref:c-type cytochrome n=1 Tax=Piscinibacter sp. HJYY11 TaxID=2801333 RepID=UPI00191D52D9|nr:cytochrome c [Piscinibacter sp. HJYY11]MBL0728575.1 cytochrome c [Piscinibacter sp. HJYY11]